MKVIILGGRSGTSAMHRILRASIPDVWGHTEPPGLSDLILQNLDRPKEIEKALMFDDWSLAKCPEFAFCTDILKSLYPDALFIWLDRPITERVNSHVNLGWHETINDNIGKYISLQDKIYHELGQAVGDNARHNDFLYFMLTDRLNTRFLAKNMESVLRIHYTDFNASFQFTMERVAQFLNIEYNPKWKELKNKKHQAGRWRPK